jgi:hypothetical protein
MRALDVLGVTCAWAMHVGIAVQLVLKPSVWSLNKINDVVGRFMNYRSKFNSWLRLPSRSTILSRGHHFDCDMALGTHDITRAWTESIALSCHAPHLDKEGRNLEKSRQAIVLVG